MAEPKWDMNVSKVENKTTQTDEGTEESFRLVLEEKGGNTRAVIVTSEPLGYAPRDNLEIVLRTPQTKLA